jgi:hypothetical protein
MRRATVALIVLTAFACLDPLYEDGSASGYFVCCQSGRVGTCACEAGGACLPNFKPCAAGLCSTTLSCGGTGGGFGFGGGFSGTGGGISGTGGGSSSAGGSAAGGSTVGGGSAAGGAGGSGAGGSAGGSTFDAGTTFDAGFAGGSAAGGSAGGGSAGGGNAGGGSVLIDAGFGGGNAGGGFVEPVFELCCVGGSVTTCQCPGGACSNAPFTACPANRCVAGTTTASCR